MKKYLVSGLLLACVCQGADVTPGKGGVTVVSGTVSLSPTNSLIVTLNPTNQIIVTLNPSNSISINNPALYDQNITNYQSSTYKFPWTAQPATITNLADGVVGETNVVILPLRLPTVKAQVTGIDYISHTNQNYGFDILVSDSPLTWPVYNATNAGVAGLVQTDLAIQIHKIKLNLYSDDLFGTNHIAFTNAIFTIPATSYWYKVYRSAFTNAGGATLCTNYVTIHFNNN